MSAGSLTGTLGVTLLLIAFALNLAKKLPAESRVCLLLNFAGPGVQLPHCLLALCGIGGRVGARLISCIF